MTTSVVSESYILFQEKMIDLLRQWEERLDSDSITAFTANPIQTEIPFTMQVKVECEPGTYQDMLHEILNLVEEWNPELHDQLQRIGAHITAITLGSTISDISSDCQLDPWILPYVTEQATRPILRMVSAKYREEITKIETKGLCPCCGEPVRLALLEKGRKMLLCPRCHASWQENRLTCSHCGNEDVKAIRYLSVDGEDKAQIHVCDHCYRYLKVIDIRAMLDKPAPELLDIQTIHLDIIAQDNI
ncbi:formate dehydrogenase accessory protein FdhE [Ammoniphilus sp. YIM 78166]|uniref:formate dehydrogenase accessory protein FdhE n=1 Tax=Ammoniphilus sp. YIM 78166 TaxID=1644106 RepID=UPI0010705C76|nr:formate dehydrogenase accessory protein FdhE [Ammoniphilus sp. YIM 78166]